MVAGYSKKQLAERWQCSERTIDRMIRLGKLTTFHIGGGKTQSSIRIHAESVSAIETPAAPERKQTRRQMTPMRRHV